jgi:hypothetical protein
MRVLPGCFPREPSRMFVYKLTFKPWNILLIEKHSQFLFAIFPFFLSSGFYLLFKILRIPSLPPPATVHAYAFVLVRFIAFVS